MKQLSFLPPIDKSIPGAVWWAGNWECRNFQGWFQSREGGAGPWQFTIYGFGETDCSVYALNPEGKMVQRRAPIDGRNRITIGGRKYGRNNWRH